MPEPTTTVTRRAVPRSSATSRRSWRGRISARHAVAPPGSARGRSSSRASASGRGARPRRGWGARRTGSARPGRRRPNPRSACRGSTGQASPQPMDTTTSAARTTSSVHGLGNSFVDVDAAFGHRARPRRVDARCRARSRRTRRWRRLPAWWLKNPSAICERPALWVHRNSTVGVADVRQAFDLRQCVEPLAGPPLSKEGKEFGQPWRGRRTGRTRTRGIGRWFRRP